MTSFPSHVLTSHQHWLVQKIPGTLCFRPTHRNLHKEAWAPKSRCFQTVALEKALESPLDGKEIKAVHSKRNQSWIFTGRTEAEAPILWPPDAKSRLIGKAPDGGKDWGQEERGKAEEETAGWRHWLSEHEFERALGDSEGQGGLAGCSPWGCKGLDTAERANAAAEVQAALSFSPSSSWRKGRLLTGRALVTVKRAALLAPEFLSYFSGFVSLQSGHHFSNILCILLFGFIIFLPLSTTQGHRFSSSLLSPYCLE